MKTVAKLALDLAGPLIAERELEFVGARQGSLLVDRIMHRLRKPGEGYLLRLSPSVPLSETVYSAIDELRRTGLDPQDLSAERFEVDVKGREIREILTEYVRELDERKWVDRAGVVRLAIQRVTSKDGRLPNDILVLCPRHRYSGTREPASLCLARATAHLVSSRPAPPKPTSDDASLTDARLLRWLPSPG